jgi:hypothetical protein
MIIKKNLGYPKPFRPDIVPLATDHAIPVISHIVWLSTSAFPLCFLATVGTLTLVKDEVSSLLIRNGRQSEMRVAKDTTWSILRLYGGNGRFWLALMEAK